jgi:radical SAM-linked protein
MLGDKFRFRFAKTGTLRLLSHHDLMRCLERMLRRADLPFKSTSGFHPGPRVVFALSLPLGVAGLDEVVEIEFTRACDSEEVLAKLREQAPIGLTFTRISHVPMKATAIPRRVVYRMLVPSDRSPALESHCSELLAREKIWVDRLKPNPKRLNIRPYLRNLHVEAVERTSAMVEPSMLNDYSLVRGREQSRVVIDLWVTQTGTARVDEIIELLNLADLPVAGAIVERMALEIHDEVMSPDPGDVPPAGPAETLPLDPTAIAVLAQRDEEQPAAAGWSMLPTGPVVE